MGTTRRLAMLVLGTLLASCGQGVGDSELKGIPTEEDFTAAEWVVRRTPTRVKKTISAEDTRKPVYVYYVVDGEESFMQVATDYSVRSLRETCKSGVNWAIFLNSRFVHHRTKKTYLRCVDGKEQTGRFPAAVDELLEKIGNPALDPSKPQENGLRYALSHKSEFASMFAPRKASDLGKKRTYPLAHPEMVDMALKQVAADFDPKSHIFFLNTYSHGAKAFLLTGMTDKQLEDKESRQREVLNKVAADISREMLNDTNPANVDRRNRVSCEARGGRWTGTACRCEDSELFINQFFGACEKTLGYAGIGSASIQELSLAAIGLGAVGRSRSDFRVTVRDEEEEGDGFGLIGGQGVGGQGVGGQGVGGQGVGGQGVGGQGVGGQGVGGQGVGGQGVGGQGVGGQGVGGQGVGGQGVGGQGVGGQGVGGQGVGGQGVGGQGVGGQGVGGQGVGGQGVGYASYTADGRAAPGVGGQGVGIEDVLGDMGAARGVGLDNHFGTPHMAFMKVLKDAGSRGMTFGLVFFESCNAKIQSNEQVKSYIEDRLDNVMGYYSSIGNLWYRNIDLDQIVGAKSARQLQQDLSSWLDDVPNYIPLRAEKSDDGDLASVGE